MTTNPYALQDRVTASAAPVAERATFLKRVYGLVLAGVLSFAATLWAAGNLAPVTDAMMGLWRMTSGRYGTLVYYGILIGAFWGVHAVARSSPLNLIAFFGLTVLLGLFTAPMVLSVAARDPSTLNTAAATTALVFTGLTAIVVLSGKDFAFLRSALLLAGWGMFVYLIAGAIWGFAPSMGFTVAGVLLFAGYILYDTSNVLRRYPTDMAVSAAVELFTDVVYLFQWILSLLSRRN
jgi:FtsH-binding integral membrane protein